MSTFVFGQSDPSGERLRVPVRELKTAQPAPEMFIQPGFVSSRTEVNPLSYYRRSRLRRWKVEREVDGEDSVFGIELSTPAGPIRIRYDISINGESFRANREKAIDDLLAIARGEKPENKSDDAEPDEPEADKPEAEADKPEVLADEVSKDRARMVAYAKSRGDRATRYELRRRIADMAGGPALLWTSEDFAADRNETHILFALLDADEDGVISMAEIDAAEAVFDRCDSDSDNRIELIELHARLTPRSSRRESQSTRVGWQSWDANRSEHVEDLSINVKFNKLNGESKLLLDDCVLSDPWGQSTAEIFRIGEEAPCGQAVLLSHPTVSIALTAAAESSTTEANQVSVGVSAESNALFRYLDQDGNWNLSQIEIDECRERVLELDRNADKAVDVSELPIMLRVCVGRGAVVHRSLQDHCTFMPLSEDSDDPKQKLTAPEWFVSMDQDGDRTLSRNEFLGDRDAFDELDEDENQRLSVEEALNLKPE